MLNGSLIGKILEPLNTFSSCPAVLVLSKPTFGFVESVEHQTAFFLQHGWDGLNLSRHKIVEASLATTQSNRMWAAVSQPILPIIQSGCPLI
jgi:hypothetical protein